MKVQKVSQTITPFAGISFIHEEFNKSGPSDLIDNHLGAGNGSGRVVNGSSGFTLTVHMTVYNYSEIDVLMVFLRT
ncbi:hypothetical protein [Seramator thermalis]|jgi:hypothetical protein|uniref:hypothetical protein n=1 Tax=Seramator thermalis TaxID=2496270 RepID=UPI00101DE759|nr:hypothetical protein [Seramator thermalis]